MLNLNTFLSFTPTQQVYINGVPKVKESWDIECADMKRVKRYMKEELWTIQDGKCAYCLSPLNPTVRNEGDLPLDGDREHIVPKSIHPTFIFEPLNFVLACITCNRTLKKDVDTIKVFNTDYQNCEFKIIHPILDNVDEHIGFDKGIITFLSLEKGKWTDELFHLSNDYYTKQRVQAYIVSLMEDDVNNILNNPFGVTNI
ncbi:hypothetical protein ALC152_19890 [Arcobacter sp. 15-2]|uniref:hypothetical protein n=1 Tax=Arcobacter sp. 15-2 TaxID=3374109 RepID=UPI00399C6C9D